MTNGLPEPVNVLCVYFAREKSLWPELFVEDKINFSSTAPDKILNFVMAEDATDILVEQIKKADVIYLRGGETSMLQATLGKVKNLRELWQGKVVAGSSAGAYVLSAHYYSSRQGNQIVRGFGLLPIKILCHYAETDPDRVGRLKLLKEYGEELKIYAIPEEKFFVIEQ